MATQNQITQPILIGICGRSCSGKGAVTKILAAGNRHAVRICLDSFFKIKSPIQTKGYDDIDVPQALMMDKLIDALRSLKKGNGTKIPYAGWTEKFSVEITRQDLKERPIIIVEGFLLFAEDELASLFDSRIFIDVSDLNILYRRLCRDGSMEGINYIYDVVIPNSWVYEDKQKGNSEVVFDGNKPVNEVTANITDYINDFISDNRLDCVMNNLPWKVFFGDLVSDHAWHPVDYDNLKDWLKSTENLRKLKNGKELPGNNFTYRQSRNISDEYEVRLNEGCNIFRYHDYASSALGQL